MPGGSSADVISDLAGMRSGAEVAGPPARTAESVHEIARVFSDTLLGLRAKNKTLTDGSFRR